MNWRALLHNQWFQLCLLVAVLSGGAIIYNISEGTTTPLPPNPVPGPTAPPRREVGKIKPKKQGNWILDSSGAHDSDGNDIEAVAASLSDGDVVTLRPGVYTGSCEIAVSARFVGPNAASGVATIRSVDPQRPGISISGKKVAFESIAVSRETAGDWPAVQISRESDVEWTNNSMSTQSKFGVLVSDSATFSSQTTEFRAVNAGCCLKFEGTAHGTLTHCTFSAGRWGVEVVNGAQLQASGCTFQGVGLVNGNGLTMGVVGGRASAVVDACEFLGNNSTILVDEGGALRLTGSTFRNNGVTGEQGNSSSGIICAQTSAKVYLKDDIFEDNKEGLVALQASSLTLERVQMRRTGLVTENQNLKSYSNAIGANGHGCVVNVTGCTIADSLSNTFWVAGGAQFKAVETTVTNTGGIGLLLGYPKLEVSGAELNNVSFLGSHGDGIFVQAGSQLSIQHCRITNSDAVGIEAQDSGSQVKLTDSTITGCQMMGLNASNSATISGFGSTMESTTRGAQAGLPNDATKRGTVFLQDCTVRGNSIFGVGACRGALMEMKGGFLGGNKENTWHEPTGTVRLGH